MDRTCMGLKGNPGLDLKSQRYARLLSSQESNGLDHSLDLRHVDPHFLANELRACSDGSSPLLTLLSSAFHHWPTVFFQFCPAASQA